MTDKTDIEDIKIDLREIRKDLHDVRDWMNQQKGGRRAFYGMMVFAAAIGGLLVKGADKIWP